jgi:hypothetical protein
LLVCSPLISLQRGTSRLFDCRHDGETNVYDLARRAEASLCLRSTVGRWGCQRRTMYRGSTTIDWWKDCATSRERMPMQTATVNSLGGSPSLDHGLNKSVFAISWAVQNIHIPVLGASAIESLSSKARKTRIPILAFNDSLPFPIKVMLRTHPL